VPLRGCRPGSGRHSASTMLGTSSWTPAAMRCRRVHQDATGVGGDAMPRVQPLKVSSWFIPMSSPLPSCCDYCSVILGG
jgi:hypothetical protein